VGTACLGDSGSHLIAKYNTIAATFDVRSRAEIVAQSMRAGLLDVH